MSKKNNNYNRLEVRETKETPEVKEDIKIDNVEDVEKKESVQLYAKVLQNLNLRTDDNLNADIMCVMDKDTEIKILASQKENEFVFVEHNKSGLTMCGYCMKKYLSEPYEK